MTCAEPGCGGTVVDGYCDVCGTAPATAAPQQPRLDRDGGERVCHVRRRAPRRCERPAPVRRRSAAARGRLGAGIVAIPRIPKGDPVAAILTDPQVPEAQPVLRQPRMQQAGRTWHGTDSPDAPRASAPSAVRDTRSFPSFLAATSSAGSTKCRDASRTAASAGSTWRSTATCDNRWVVLKGLLNSGDADAMAAAAAEVLALAEVEHPNIVRIYNFVEHADAAGVPVGYIVMEYVGGTSLKQIRKARNAPLPPDQAVAYIVEIAPALGLPALAGARLLRLQAGQRDADRRTAQAHRPRRGRSRMDDEESAIYGTVGYQAPEIARTGPTVASDVYTVGRTLAVLVMDVPQENGRFVEQLPGPATVPVLAQARIVVPARSCAPPTPIRTGASRPWRRWPTS